MAQQSARIVTTPDVLGGEPRIAGRRIGVLFIYEQVEGRDLSARTVADRYDLDIADVYHALAYYHEHPREMSELRERRERVEREAADDPNVVTGPGDVHESSQR
ncbi:DUF433 domain-containing protein [Halomarina pelagica]|uniref:DUF433 domain-containing protein n=1 Tax=Halomarina pelagica TaxID=2961599 RepID=UPI0020C22DE8|nr:DUF433 domain-containing protein [Halomarina sp. BND7]